jgi:hypothetical protein
LGGNDTDTARDKRIKEDEAIASSSFMRLLDRLESAPPTIFCSVGSYFLQYFSLDSFRGFRLVCALVRILLGLPRSFASPLSSFCKQYSNDFLFYPFGLFVMKRAYYGDSLPTGFFLDCAVFLGSAPLAKARPAHKH